MKSKLNQQACFKLVPTFYTSKMEANFNSFSPSAGKPAKAVSSWQKLGLPIEVIEPELVSTSNLKLAHSHDFVDHILACEINNCFGNRLAQVADSLPYTTGSMLAAAREAIKNG